MAMIGVNVLVTGVTGKLIIRWVKASAPLAEVGRSAAFDIPYDAVYTIPNLARVVYKVQLWRSDDGIALDQLIKEWPINAAQTGVSTMKVFQYKVDRGFNNVNQATGDDVWADPENEDVALTDERLDGYTKDQLLVHESGYGNKINSDYELLLGGGIELNDGFTFNTGTSWTISVFEDAMIDLPPDGGTSSPYEGVVEVDANRDMFVDESDNLYNKLALINSDAQTIQVNIPDLTTISDGKYVTFNTHKGTQNYLILQFDVGDTVRANNQDLNVLYIPKNQVISLFFFDGECHITTPTEYLLRRGTILQDYDLNRDNFTLAVIEADEATGELTKAAYPGLYDHVFNLTGSAVAPLGSLVGQWGYSNAGVFENKSKFGLDTGAETFRVPHLTGLTPKYGTTPGSYEADSVGAFSFTYDYKQGKSDDNESGVSGEYLRKAGATGGTNYGNTSITYNVNTGQDNKVKSVIQKAYIVL